MESSAYVTAANLRNCISEVKPAAYPSRGVWDKAYFRKPILDTLQTEAVGHHSVNACVYKLDESGFSYNKDSDQWFAKWAIIPRRKCAKNTEQNDVYRYHFVKSHCAVSVNLTAGKNTEEKVLRVSEHCAQ
ncbi:hypothetical protein [Sporomusa termitida]|uniref:hypothetical protein n=1 Tax=Sporomusa termitida TaxID=2377 RepID=UPI00147903E3|nr:hypothetical protein [Sporomusa termitida]